MNSYEHISTSTCARSIATVCIERPKLHNAFNDKVVAELTHAFEHLNSQESVRAILLCSEGRSFSAGADLNWMQSMVNYSREENITDALAMAKMYRSMDRCQKPLVAKVQGAAIGGGAALVAVADIAIASERARFAFSEVRLGIIPAVISPFVISKIGSSAARRYFLTGERFNAERALQMGLISQVASEDKLEEEVQSVLSELLLASPDAIRAAKQLQFDVSDRLNQASEQVDQFTAEAIATQRASSAGQAGMNAFLQKQAAPWLVKED